MCRGNNTIFVYANKRTTPKKNNREKLTRTIILFDDAFIRSVQIQGKSSKLMAGFVKMGKSHGKFTTNS